MGIKGQRKLVRVLPKELTPEQVETLANDCVRLRRTGWSVEHIAKVVQVPIEKVEDFIKDHIATYNPETAEQLRTLEGQRLDRLQRAVWARAMEGDLKAVDRVLRIINTRCELFGINKPVTQNVNITGKIEHKKSLKLEALTMEELDKLDAILAKTAPEMLESGEVTTKVVDVTEVSDTAVEGAEDDGT